jgi:hypothetical protein
LPHPFNSEVVENYILDCLWFYLVGLFEGPSTLRHVEVRIWKGNNKLQNKTPIGKPYKRFCRVGSLLGFEP